MYKHDFLVREEERFKYLKFYASKLGHFLEFTVKLVLIFLQNLVKVAQNMTQRKKMLENFCYFTAN